MGSEQDLVVNQIRDFCTRRGVDAGKARRVVYLELVASLGDSYSPTAIAQGVKTLEQSGEGVYFSGLQKMLGQSYLPAPDLGEEPQSGCLYLFKR